MATNAPRWLSTTIADGLTRMYALNLEGCPGADVLEGTIAVWVDDIWARMQHDEELSPSDRARIDAAFRALRLSSTRWPTPKHFFDQLRPREVPRPIALPPGDIGEAERARRILDNERRRALLKAGAEDFLS